MVETDETTASVAAVLRGHVLSPVSTARDVLEVEKAEIAAEREAFEKFRDRVAGIETVSTRHTGPATRSYAGQPRSRAVERVRSAFRETVMSVDHYDRTYGEPMIEHAAAELSPDVAAGLQGGAGTPFTDAYKNMLVGAVSETVEQRDRFVRTLEAEGESLDRAEAELAEILATLDGPRVPEYHREEFDRQLSSIADRRQETIRTHHFPSRVDGHDLCQYLYDDREWTYPVLTAVTRLSEQTGEYERPDP